jgi:hypothetical protein
MGVFWSVVTLVGTFLEALWHKGLLAGILVKSLEQCEKTLRAFIHAGLSRQFLVKFQSSIVWRGSSENICITQKETTREYINTKK